MELQALNFGVIGAGGIARRRTIPAMLQAGNCRVVAVMDTVDPGSVAAEFEIPRAYRDETDLLADPEVQAVYIASPVACHARQIERAAAAGKHILCEKPLTMSLAETREAVACCKRHGVFLQEGFMMKFHGAHVLLKDLIDAGRLGRLVYLRAQLSCWYPKIAGAWRQDPATGGGGALIDMATHLYDLLVHFAGPVQRIEALTGNLVQDYRSEDASTTLLGFASGAQATVDCFYCIPDEASRTRLEVYGSQGAVLAEGTIGQGDDGLMEGIFGLGDAAYDAQQDKGATPGFRPLEFERINPYTAECRYFANCVLGRRPPEINGGDNAIYIAELTDRAYRP
jgi:predicted dehydrogenase